MAPSWFYDRNYFSSFLSTKQPHASYQVWSQLAFGSEEAKINFHFDSHLGFRIRTVSTTFDLQVTPMLPTKFLASWLSGSGEEAKNRFSRWSPQQPSWNSDWNAMLPTKFQINWPFGSGEAKNRFFQDLGFWIGTILAICLPTSHPDASYQV